MACTYPGLLHRGVLLLLLTCSVQFGRSELDGLSSAVEEKAEVDRIVECVDGSGTVQQDIQPHGPVKATDTMNEEMEVASAVMLLQGDMAHAANGLRDSGISVDGSDATPPLQASPLSEGQSGRQGQPRNPERPADAVPWIHAEFPVADPTPVLLQHQDQQRILSLAATKSSNTFLITVNTLIPGGTEDNHEVDVDLSTTVNVTDHTGTEFSAIPKGTSPVGPGTYSCQGHTPGQGHLVSTSCKKVSSSQTLAERTRTIVECTLGALDSQSKAMAISQLSSVIRSANSALFIIDQRIFDAVVTSLHDQAETVAAAKNSIVSSQDVAHFSAEGAFFSFARLFGRFAFS